MHISGMGTLEKRKIYMLRQQFVDEYFTIKPEDSDYRLVTQAKIVALSQVLNMLGYVEGEDKTCEQCQKENGGKCGLCYGCKNKEREDAKLQKEQHLIAKVEEYKLKNKELSEQIKDFESKIQDVENREKLAKDEVSDLNTGINNILLYIDKFLNCGLEKQKCLESIKNYIIKGEEIEIPEDDLDTSEDSMETDTDNACDTEEKIKKYRKKARKWKKKYKELYEKVHSL